MRPMYLAGSWYPQGDAVCRAAIQRHAAEAQPEQGLWRGLLAPHAGWRWCGSMAARAFAWLAQAQAAAELVVVFGSHRGRHGPNTQLVEGGWQTPLGAISLDVPLAQALGEAHQLQPEPLYPLYHDNGIEILLPFVKYFFPAARGLFVGVAAAPIALEIGATVGRLCREHGRNALFVGSTDLTHYGPCYQFTPHGPAAAALQWVRHVNDRGFLQAGLQGNGAALLEHGLARQSSCCPGAAAAALVAAQTFGASGQIRLIEHALSYDLEPGEEFVGYGTMIF